MYKRQTSATSLARQGAVTGIITTDANGNLASDGGALEARVTALEGGGGSSKISAPSVASAQTAASTSAAETAVSTPATADQATAQTSAQTSAQVTTQTPAVNEPVETRSLASVETDRHTGAVPTKEATSNGAAAQLSASAGTPSGVASEVLPVTSLTEATISQSITPEQAQTIATNTAGITANANNIATNAAAILTNSQRLDGFASQIEALGLSLIHI